MIAFPDHGLYAITDGPRADLERVAAQVLRGGARVLQYRDPSRDLTRRLHEAQALKQLCVRYAVPLLIEQDIELARAAEADGVHVGSADDVAKARALLGPQSIVGVACRDSLDHARAAADAGASYVSFGAFFASPTLPHAGRAPLELLPLSASLRIPRVAIGGITPDNAPVLVEAGADCIAAISSLFGAADPASAARRFAQLFPFDREHT